MKRALLATALVLPLLCEACGMEMAAAQGVVCLKSDGKTPEPCELRQQRDMRPSSPIQNLHEWRIMPPVEFDKPYHGKLTEIRVPPETMRAICPKTPLPLTLACTYPTHDQSQCLVIMVSDDIILAAGWSPAAIRRHELAHCLGWPNTHPGMRALTQKEILQYYGGAAK